MTKEQLEELSKDIDGLLTTTEIEDLIVKVHKDYFKSEGWQGCSGVVSSIFYLLRQDPVLAEYVKANMDDVIKDYIAYRSLTKDYFYEGRKEASMAEITMYVSFSIKYMRDDDEKIFIKEPKKEDPPIV